MEEPKKIEHPRTYLRHYVDSENSPDIGYRTLCGRDLPNTPGRFMRDGDTCSTCRELAQQNGLIEA